MLLEHGADPNQREQWIVGTYNGGPAITVAAHMGNTDAVRELLAYSADPTLTGFERHITDTMPPSRGVTPIYLAATKGHVDVLTLLLNANVDPDTQEECLDKHDPLFAAQAGGHLEAVKLLLAANANPNCSGKFFHPLFDAALNGRYAIVKELLRHRSTKINQEAMGCTSLHAAAERAQLQTAQLLVLYGADIHAVDRRGLGIISIAREAAERVENPELIEKYRVFVQWAAAVFPENDTENRTDLNVHVNWSRWKIGAALRWHADVLYLLR